MNWVWPISPAQAPRISWGAEIAALDDAQRVHQFSPEHLRAAAIVSQRRQRTYRRKFSDVDAEVGLEPPDRHQHLARHAVALFDAPEHRAILLHHVGAAREAGRDHAAGELLETLTEDPLRTIPRQHRLIQRHATQAGCDRRLGDAFGGGFGLEIVEPRIKAAGATGCGKRRRRRYRQDDAHRECSEKETKGHRRHQHRNRFAMKSDARATPNVPGNRGQNKAFDES